MAREPETLYQDIVHASFDGILVTDSNYNVVAVNEAYERITGIKISSIQGRNIRDIYNLVWLKKSVAELVSQYRQPVTKRQITQLGTEIMVTGKPLLDKDGEIRLIIINVRDIPEIYQFQEEEILRSSGVGQKKLQIQVQADKQIIIASDQSRGVYSLAKRVGNFQSTVLILGESGVGKEAVAHYIHMNSMRKDKPFVVVNCGAIPQNLLESELFGYEKGAFTGASAKGKVGLLEAADGGTVFLDEIGEISPDFQVKLLRVLENKEILPVGATRHKKLDLRVVAATNRNLQQMVAEESFREDLYYRLNVIEIVVPPLRERVDDIRPLCLYFLKHYNAVYGLSKKLTPDAIRELERQSWPGNVRQLKNTIERTVLMSPYEYIQRYDLPWLTGKNKESVDYLIQEIMQADTISLKDAVEALERQLFLNAKKKYKTKKEIADAYGIDQSTVLRKLKKYNL